MWATYQKIHAFINLVKESYNLFDLQKLIYNLIHITGNTPALSNYLFLPQYLYNFVQESAENGEKGHTRR